MSSFALLPSSMDSDSDNMSLSSLRENGLFTGEEITLKSQGDSVLTVLIETTSESESSPSPVPSAFKSGPIPGVIQCIRPSSQRLRLQRMMTRAKNRMRVAVSRGRMDGASRDVDSKYDGPHDENGSFMTYSTGDFEGCMDGDVIKLNDREEDGLKKWRRSGGAGGCLESDREENINLDGLEMVLSMGDDKSYVEDY